ncbi:hypothetical protein KC669_02400 [Candidatus Dojkabacteria bacterium]|uniref:Uncharacterized protein n=1 Tax=Candidatus Dojkabacteria bacterium TaxID=2099670 RepID=A0A955LB22_9BACT|nr:hypothetical protein [Candidatus Dojkabacteria bacterium]
MGITLIFICAWALVIPLAILNGLIREKVYRKYLSDLRSHQLSTFVFILILFIYTKLLLLLINKDISTITLWSYGALWLFLTIIFEFVFGHYLMKHPWKKLLHDYNIFKGRLWILVLVTILVAPALLG